MTATKTKAAFQIFLLLASLFSISMLSAPVEAQEQQVCCAETVSGEHCVYTDVSSCAPGSMRAAASCEQTSFCKLGCGFDQNEGQCFTNLPKFSCEQEEGCSWSENPSCDIPQCQKGCCVLSNQCSFTTQLECKQITSQFEDINMTFHEEITSEAQCINECRSFERGACVHEDGSCEFTTREACSETGTEQTVVNTNNTNGSAAPGVAPRVGFHPDRLCSNPNLGTECAAQHRTGCLPDQDEVYWFDSCGNAENIYSSNRQASYNNGFILSKEESCSPQNSNVDSEVCGNCNYALGTICDLASVGVNPTYGDYACKDLSCDVDVVHVEPTAPATSQLPLENGESWCAYDGLVGFSENAGLGLDLAGSRHYRRICINGEELTEPCRDFREEICIQGEIDPNDLNAQNFYTVQESFALGSSDRIIAGACRPNRFESCVEITEKEDCENNAQRDCIWILGETEKAAEGVTACVPLVSPGLKHWSGESSTTTSSVDPKSTCEMGNSECVAHFYKPGIGLFEGGANWRCVANCECLDQSYLESANAVCKSLGDCGAWYNIAGEQSCSGLVENLDDSIPGVDGDPEVCDTLPPFGDLVGTGEESEEDYSTGFGLFLEKSWIPLTGIALTGIWGLLASGSAGGFALGVTTFYDTIRAPFVEEGIGELFTSRQSSVFGQSAVTSKVSVKAGESLAGSMLPKGTVFTGTGTDAFTKLSTEKLTELGVEKTTSGGYKVIAADGVGASALEAQGLTEIKSGAAQEVMQQGTNTLLTVVQIVNVLLTLWTIYNIIDILFDDSMTQTITVNCNVWQAPTGGDKCDECQDDGKVCSEYRCKSLGQSCQLINVGTEEEKCIAGHTNDVTPPFITVNKAETVQLTDSINSVNDIQETQGRGFTITPKIAPFTAVSLSLNTNEFAQCKYDVNVGVPFEEMQQFFGSSLYNENHTITFSLPGALAEEEILRLTNGGEYQIYIKCQDGNGNANEADYFAKFRIDDGPDFTPPVIETTSIENGGYVPAGVNETAFSIYVNEPASCKWDDVDTDFSQMLHDFSCVNTVLPTASIYYGLYECSTILTGIEDGKTNNFYFRCEDHPEKPPAERNVNTESFAFSLEGTGPLSIESVYPDGGVELFTNSPILRVVTSGGAFGNGAAICGYNFDDPSPLSAIEFLNTNASVHEQPFFNLTAQAYNAYVTCADIAGNFANETAEFTISVDTGGPQLLQVYTEPGILYIITDEPSSCEYRTDTSFTFGSGIPMTGANTEEHTASLEGSLFYVLCQDSFENTASYVIQL